MKLDFGRMWVILLWRLKSVVEVSRESLGWILLRNSKLAGHKRMISSGIDQVFDPE